MQHAPSCANLTVKIGDWCEGDGECGTLPHLNNCLGGYDVYQRVNATIDESQTNTNSYYPTKPPKISVRSSDSPCQPKYPIFIALANSSRDLLDRICFTTS